MVNCYGKHQQKERKGEEKEQQHYMIFFMIFLEKRLEPPYFNMVFLFFIFQKPKGERTQPWRRRQPPRPGPLRVQHPGAGSPAAPAGPMAEGSGPAAETGRPEGALVPHQRIREAHEEEELKRRRRIVFNV